MEGYWSQGSVLVIVGMTTYDDDLLQRGFSLILNEDHEIAPPLINIIYMKLEANGIIDHVDEEQRNEEQLREWMPSWIEELDVRLHEQRQDVIDHLLKNLPKGDLN
tara:strand:+ start:2793 stop:3110 length:318 start_codon:yes stop_codon:yes gene_type:complete